MSDHPNHPDYYTRHSSLRLPAYDYSSAGAYYVTICTEQRKPVFEAPVMRNMLVEVWQSLPIRFPAVTLDEFVVMPDHIHGILWLDDANAKKKAPKLDRVIGAYKSVTTVAWIKYNKAISMPYSKHLWQRGYYEHVIRNEEDLALTRQYIRDNPLKREIRLEEKRLGM